MSSTPASTKPLQVSPAPRNLVSPPRNNIVQDDINPEVSYLVLRHPHTKEYLHCPIDTADIPLIRNYKWRIDVMPSGNIPYVATGAFVEGRDGTRKITLQLLLLNRVGVQDQKQVDHINGPVFGGLDNRRSNLRLVTRKQNLQNSAGRRITTRTSQFKGIVWRKKDQVWTAQIKIGPKLLHLGTFRDEIEAAKAYDYAAYHFHREYAFLNFPEALGFNVSYPFGVSA